MMKLLIGGSPCTHWSIAQTKNRETEPEGIGWELFKNYLIALEKYKPDYFLYENNKSVSAAIRAQITKELGVEPIEINSALVSAQSRKRLYWTNIPGVEQPEDRGILLRDILESGVVWQKKAYTLRAAHGPHGGPSSVIKTIKEPGKFSFNGVAEPVRVGDMPNAAGKVSGSQSGRVYSIDAKSVPLQARPNGGGVDGATTGLYAVPLEDGGSGCSVYVVQDGQITIKGKQYPIKLADGYYIIRKLTVTECKRLQTVPEEYIFPVSDTQAYKMLGNGWTVDVIAHILGHIPHIQTQPVEVFSMYDGMSCGRIALNKIGAHIAAYYATEIDKHAIQTTQTNYPDNVQLGDAFQVRETDWRIGDRRISGDPLCAAGKRLPASYK